MLFARVRTRCEARHSLVHRRGGVRHGANDRDSAEAALDQRGRDRGCDRDDRLLGPDLAADLLEEDLDVLRLHGDHDDRDLADCVGVRERRLDAVALGELVETLLAASGSDEVGPAGRDEPGDQRLADLSGAENGDLPVH
jgi:hypothetical protein